jgi:sulfoxide reductase catalytic subunit YedY
LNRRKFLRGAASSVVAAGAAAMGMERVVEMVSPRVGVRAGAQAGTKLETVKSPLTTTGEDLTSFNDITHYNNFYEFGVNKDDPAKNAGVLPTRPWTVKVTGKVKAQKTFDIDALLKLRPLEDRVYRHRCVEAWSMVIPWVGYSFSEFIKQCDPLPSAKYVQFLSYFDRRVETWTSESTIDWPYSEGLRMDEAMNPLTLLTFGLYGEVLPKQLEPEDGEAHWLAFLRAAKDDADVQWIWGAGGFAVSGDEFEEGFLRAGTEGLRD